MDSKTAVMNSFGTVDYVLFSLGLGLSAVVGVYHALRAKSGTDQFLLGNRRLPLFPTAVSLLTSFISGISLLSYPEEIYRMGTAFCWSLVGAIMALVITGYVILPVMFRLRYVSLYQYFEDRFGSKVLRYYMTLLFILSTIFYLATALYVPCVALSLVTVIPTYGLILLTGTICTIYTAIGGIKAVIWTDTFQGILMYVGIIALLVRGIYDVGVQRIPLILKDSLRLDGLTNIDPDPFQYMTVWTAIFGSCFYWLSAFGGNQIALQRYCGLKDVKSAQLAVALNIPGISIVFVLVFAIGLIMYAYYAGCDPGVSKDKLVMTYMLTALHEIHGLPGLFMAGVLSATLSSVSSGINSLAAVTWHDFVLLLPASSKLSPNSSTLVTKLLSAIFGAAIIGVAFAVKPMGGALSALLSFLGALGGPAVGLLLLGLLVSWSDTKGAYVGVIFGSLVNVALFTGRLLYSPDNDYALPVSTDCCNSSCIQVDSLSNFTFMEPQKYGFEKIFSISSLMLPLVGAIITMLFGSIVSGIKKKSTISKDVDHLIFWKYKHSQPHGFTNYDTINFLEDAEHYAAEMGNEENNPRRKTSVL